MYKNKTLLPRLKTILDDLQHDLDNVYPTLVSYHIQYTLYKHEEMQKSTPTLANLVEVEKLRKLASAMDTEENAEIAQFIEYSDDTACLKMFLEIYGENVILPFVRALVNLSDDDLEALRINHHVNVEVLINRARDVKDRLAHQEYWSTLTPEMNLGDTLPKDILFKESNIKRTTLVTLLNGILDGIMQDTHYGDSVGTIARIIEATIGYKEVTMGVSNDRLVEILIFNSSISSWRAYSNFAITSLAE